KEKMTYYDLPNSDKGWEVTEIDLGEEAGQTAYALSLQIRNEESVGDYSLQLGQLSVYDKEEKVAAPTEVEIDEKLMKSAEEAEARLSWKEQKNVRYYEIYQENAKGDTAFLGTTPNNHFYTKNISRTEENASKNNLTAIKVVPVSNKYDRVEGSEVKFEIG